MKLQAKTNRLNKFKINWRLVWYSVLIWFFGIIIAGFVIIPWFYLVVTMAVLLTTIFYFKILNPLEIKRGRRRFEERDRILAFGLFSAMLWFFIIIILNIFEIANLYYFNFLLYFSDFRNWYLYVLILLVPILYSLILENMRSGRNRKRNVNNSSLISFLSPKSLKLH